MKLTLGQQYMFSVLHNQCHACWCSGGFRSQGISRHVIDPKAGIFRLQYQGFNYKVTHLARACLEPNDFSLLSVSIYKIFWGKNNK